MAGGATRTSRNPAPVISVRLKPSELELLVSLAADQLFRREFIDPKMPGYKGSAAEMAQGKELVGRLRAALASGTKRPMSRVVEWRGGD